MTIRIPAIIEISDDGIATILSALTSDSPGSGPLSGKGQLAGTDVELPERWDRVQTDSGVRYTWGDDHDVYDPFITYEGQISKGKVKLAIGKCQRTRVHGQDRIYYIVISIGPEGGMRAIAEFLATDDYDDTKEVIAIIKGKEGSGRQFDSAEELPLVYRQWNTVTYRDRVDYPSSYLKQGLVCSEEDAELMLNHSLAQIQLRDL